MKASVLAKQGFHHLPADTASVAGRVDQHVGKVHDEVSVRYGVANANKLFVDPGSDECVGATQRGK